MVILSRALPTPAFGSTKQKELLKHKPNNCDNFVQPGAQ
jgi:hypothetical protein